MALVYAEEIDESLVGQAPNDIFPDFLWNPLINDFGVDYYRIGTMNDPVILKARNLRKKYSNFFDYVDALEIYKEYVQYLIDKYGSWSIVKNSAEVGMLDEFLPSEPKLKMTKKNKQYLRAGTVPSRKYFDTDPADVNLVASQMFPTQTGESISDFDDGKIDKSIKKIIRKASEKAAATERKRNLFASASNSYGSDLIVEYFNQMSKGGFYNSSGSLDNSSLMDIVEEDRRARYIPPELLDLDATANKGQIVGGRLVRKSDMDQIQIITDLYNCGIDILGSAAKKMNKQSVKMLKSTLGYQEGPMTKKELKKLKKKQKRDNKAINEYIDGDQRLAALLSNKRSGVSTRNFRLQDIYKGEKK